jgi:hypothetical protein
VSKSSKAKPAPPESTKARPAKPDEDPVSAPASEQNDKTAKRIPPPLTSFKFVPSANDRRRASSGYVPSAEDEQQTDILSKDDPETTILPASPTKKPVPTATGHPGLKPVVAAPAIKPAPAVKPNAKPVAAKQPAPAGHPAPKPARPQRIQPSKAYPKAKPGAPEPAKQFRVISDETVVHAEDTIDDGDRR